MPHQIQAISHLRNACKPGAYPRHGRGRRRTLLLMARHAPDADLHSLCSALRRVRISMSDANSSRTPFKRASRWTRSSPCPWVRRRHIHRSIERLSCVAFQTCSAVFGTTRSSSNTQAWRKKLSPSSAASWRIGVLSTER
ncbi:hypothetical protein MRB53_041032 [Persea americana]|nr:hypothetical protein MRB53_041032 [Persea americana]